MTTFFLTFGAMVIWLIYGVFKAVILDWPLDRAKEVARDAIVQRFELLIAGVEPPLCIAWELSALILRMNPNMPSWKAVFHPERVIWAIFIFLLWLWVKHALIQDSNLKVIFEDAVVQTHKAGGVCKTAAGVKEKATVFGKAIVRAINAASEKVTNSEIQSKGLFPALLPAFLDEIAQLKVSEAESDKID